MGNAHPVIQTPDTCRMRYGERGTDRRSRKSLRHYTRASNGFCRESGVMCRGFVNAGIKPAAAQSL